ncbi:helix-turn-helix domain-containing protein [Citrobacter braakii]|uniref:helix-turn-helix domain-containing protein n=1 Tax=Citrobacter braakii TaxID=57706 RepID=UPI0024B137F8|nr:helix-turn-helix domain-containing protein [Citrobacter braakii]WFX01697.1 helix-turn-helix domain containing protein [Citrobacter braakii]
MTDRKTNELDIDEVGKTSIADRLRELIGKRSVRQAAADWGLSFSTLNNYLTRGTEPSLNVAIKISKVEQVRVEWLATGQGPAAADESGNAVDKNDGPTEDIWSAVYASLTNEERSALIRLIHRKGIEGILSLGESKPAIDVSAQTLSPQMRQIIEVVSACTEAELREILQGVAHIKSTTLPGSESVSQVSKKVG